MGVLPGQGFTIVKRFADASARPTAYRVRITLTDRAGTVSILSAPLPPPGKATTVSAANYKAESITNGAIVAAFGLDLATSTLVARTVPLPTELGGTRVLITDVNGTERPAPLFFVSPGQINYQIPDQTALGVAKVIINSGSGSSSEGTVTIIKVGPAIFTSNASGSGIPSGLVLRVKKDNSQTYEPLARYDTATAKFVAIPIDFGTVTGVDADKLFLILFGTGWRANTGISALTARIVNTATTATNPVSLPILYAGPQGGLIGLDQLNLQLPTTLKGRATIDFQFTADGKAANTVMVTMK